MGYDTATKTDPESVVPEAWGGMWFLTEALETNDLGISVLELEPEGKGKEHDETHTGQEEVYFVVTGTVAIDLPDSDETVTLTEDDAIRLDPDETRQIHNRGDERAKLLLVGAPL